MKTLLATIALAFAITSQAAVYYEYTVALTFLVQGDTVQSVPTIENTAKPSKVAVKTKDLLARMAQAEYMAGNYGSTSFPAGSRLIYVAENDGGYFVVVDYYGNFLCDVSDICWVEHNGTTVFSGETLPSIINGTYIYPETFFYDDGVISFNTTGTCTEKASITGSIIYSTCKTPGQTGSGLNGPTPFIVSGSTAARAQQL